MAKRMASSAEAQKTNSSTSPRRKYRSSLRSISVRLRVAAMPGECSGNFLHGRCFLSLVGRPEERFVFPRRVSDGSAHEINPTGQGRLPAGFFFAHGLLPIKADPNAAGDAG